MSLNYPHLEYLSDLLLQKHTLYGVIYPNGHFDHCNDSTFDTIKVFDDVITGLKY